MTSDVNVDEQVVDEQVEAEEPAPKKAAPQKAAPRRSTARQPKAEENTWPAHGVVYTSTRKPGAKIAVVVAGVHTGRWLKFNSTKLVVTNPADADFLDNHGAAGIYREPDEFLELESDDPSFFVHRDTGFKTLCRDAFEDWINNSEWSATPGRRG